MEILNIVTQAANRTREQIIQATGDELDELLQEVLENPDARRQLEQRGIRTLADLRTQVDAARQGLATDRQPRQGRETTTRNQETVKSSVERAAEDKRNEEQKSAWRDYVVSPDSVPVVNNIPLIGRPLAYALAGLGTIITAKPVGGAVTNLSYLALGREGVGGKVSRFLGTVARIAAVAAMGYYGFKYLMGSELEATNRVGNAVIDAGGNVAPTPGVSPPVNPVGPVGGGGIPNAIPSGSAPGGVNIIGPSNPLVLPPGTLPSGY